MADPVVSTETSIPRLDNAHHNVAIRKWRCSLRPRYWLLFVSV